MKVLVADILECRYEEGPNRFMERTVIPDLLTIKRTRGDLVFRQIENNDTPSHVVVFGWVEKCEPLSNGRARVTVTPLSELHQRVLLEPVQEMTEGNVIFW